MMQLATALPLGNAQLAELHHRAQRDALARAARATIRKEIEAKATTTPRRLDSGPGRRHTV